LFRRPAQSQPARRFFVSEVRHQKSRIGVLKDSDMVCTQYSVLPGQYTVFGLLLISSLACGGCQPAAKSAAAPARLTPERLNLIQGDAKALDELIARHKGEVVLVDYWATWCGPCVQNFPHTVELANKYRNQGLATIAVSFDLLDDEPKVREFLATQGADFENVISKHDAIGQKPAEDFDIGPLPEYRLYDRQGKLDQKWEGQAEEINKLATKIEELLAAKP